MIKAIAVDDEPLALEIIETYCQSFDFLDCVRGFTKVGEALQYLEKNPVDLLFLDINMPAMLGIDFYKSLKIKPKLIFTTSYTEFAIESYEIGAIDYLLKPFSKERFAKAIERVTENHQLNTNSSSTSNQNYLLLKADYAVKKIFLADILYIESLDNYLKIHLQDQQPVIVRLTLKHIQEKLPGSDFFRVHKSFIVPFNRILSVRNKVITIANVEIPIGRIYEDAFTERFNKLVH